MNLTLKSSLGILLSAPCFAAEFKLPENFLVFDPSRLRSAVSKSAAQLSHPLLSPPRSKIDACAHIRILPTPENVDPGIVLPAGARTSSKMPIVKGLPSCQHSSR